MDPSWDMLPIYYHEILPIGSQYDSHLTNGTNTTKYYSPFHSIWFPFNIPIRFPWDHIPYHEISWNGTVSSHFMHLPGERRCGPVFPQAPQREQQGRGRAGRTARSREAEGGCLAGDWATWRLVTWVMWSQMAFWNHLKPIFLNMLKPWKPMFFCFCLVGLVYPVCHIMVGNSGCRIVRTLGPTVWPIFRDVLTSH